MAQEYRYPSSSQVTVAAIGPNGLPIPPDSILIAGEDGAGDLTPVSVDNTGAVNVNVMGISGTVTADQGAPAALGSAWPVKLTDGAIVNTFTANGLKVDVAASVLPTGAATEATLAAASAKLPATLGQNTMANSLAVAIASDQSAIPVSAASLPLPSGAATAANQAIALTRLSGALVPTAFDEIDLTYVVAGPGTGQVATAVYKLAASTVKTLTLSYDGSDRLSSVVAS